MRQTLWAEQMVLHTTKETLQADSFLHVHVIPEENTDLLNKTYPCSGHDMESTWRNHLHNKAQYKIISPKNLMAILNPKTYQDLLSYLSMRYWD